MTASALVAGLPARPAEPPFGGRPAYPDPRRPGGFRLCRVAWPRAGWEDDGSGIPPRCYKCGRSITPTARRVAVGVASYGVVIYAWLRSWRHLPIRRRSPIYGEGAEARPLPPVGREAHTAWAARLDADAAAAAAIIGSDGAES